MGIFLLTYWFEVVLFIVAAVPSIILFAIKGRISHWFAKDLKKYEQQLDAKNREIQNIFDTRLEQMRIEYGTLYQRRILAIERLYLMTCGFKALYRDVVLKDYYDSLGGYTLDYTAWIDKFQELISQFERTFEESSIYFNDSDRSKIKLFINSFNSTKGAIIEYQTGNCNFEDLQVKILQTPTKDLELIEIIENRFRDLIGIKAEE